MDLVWVVGSLPLISYLYYYPLTLLLQYRTQRKVGGHETSSHNPAIWIMGGQIIEVLVCKVVWHQSLLTRFSGIIQAPGSNSSQVSLLSNMSLPHDIVQDMLL